MLFFLFWFIFSLIPVSIAKNRGNSGLAIFIISIILSPLIGIIVALVSKKDIKSLEDREIKLGNLKKCPYCAESIKAEASICKYCEKEQPLN